MRKAILHLKRADPVLAGIIDRVGPCRIVYRAPSFETLVRSIVYQQISGKVAAAIFGRLAPHASEPARILGLSDVEMRQIGLSRQKIAYLRDLAQRSKSGEINFAALQELPDEEVIAKLTAVKGIGVWTVQMFLIFGLRRPDVLPAADLGVRAAIKKAYELEELPAPKLVAELALPWRPYASVASWYLWRSLDGPAGI